MQQMVFMVINMIHDYKKLARDARNEIRLRIYKMPELQAKDALAYLTLKFTSIMSPQQSTPIEHINYEKKMAHKILDEASMNWEILEKIIEEGGE